MIKLRNEGPIKPAPQLQGLAQSVSAEVQAWPDMLSVTHWQLGDPTRVDGAEFHVRDAGELGHIHLNSEIHLALTKPLRDQLVELRLAQPFVWNRAWVTVQVASQTDADQALWLLRLGYDCLRLMPEEVLTRRIREHAEEYSRYS